MKKTPTCDICRVYPAIGFVQDYDENGEPLMAIGPNVCGSCAVAITEDDTIYIEPPQTTTD